MNETYTNDMQVSRLGGLSKKRNLILASAIVSALGFSTGYADTLNMAAQKATISNKVEAGAGTVLKLWFADENGNMTSMSEAYTVEISNTATAGATIATHSLAIPAQTMSATLNVGGDAADMSVSGEGAASLLAMATASASTTTMQSAEVPLTVVADYLKASTTLGDGTNIGQWVDFSMTDSAGQAVAGDASVAHVAGGIGSMPVEVVPSALIANNAGSLTLNFSEPTGTVTTAGNEYYVVSSAGYGDAVVAAAGDAVAADIVIPAMASAANILPTGSAAGVTGGVSMQDNNFASMFDADFAAVSETDDLNINLSITPDPAHTGQDANKMLVVGYLDIFDAFGLGTDTFLAWSLSSDKIGFVTWNYGTDPLPGHFTSKKLTGEPEAYHVYSGPLMGMPGYFVFFAGYSLADGTLVYNGQPASLIVAPAQ